MSVIQKSKASEIPTLLAERLILALAPEGAAGGRNPAHAGKTVAHPTVPTLEQASSPTAEAHKLASVHQVLQFLRVAQEGKILLPPLENAWVLAWLVRELLQFSYATIAQIFDTTPERIAQMIAGTRKQLHVDSLTPQEAPSAEQSSAGTMG